MTTRTLEVRSAALGAVELRAAAENQIGTLHGYAAVFNRYSQNLGGFVEVVDPACFNKSLADDVPVMARFNHNDNLLIGTTEANTLRLEVDGTGLAYDVDLPDTSTGRDLHALGKRGDIRYSSFAFYTVHDEWGVTEQGFPLRILRSVQLVDVAPVANPAYRDTTVAVRSLCERLGVEVEEIPSLEPDELRSRLVDDAGSAQDREEPPAPHATMALRSRLLELEALR